MKVLFTLILFTLSDSAFCGTLKERLEGFATHKESHASFIETWSADYLDESLTSRGKLSYKAPDILSKIIEDPGQVEQHISGNKLSIIRNNETQTMQLSEEPALAAGIYALRDILSGNYAGLKTHFQTDFKESENNWTLKLTPNNKQAADKIDSIVFSGTNNYILKTHIQYSSGDQLLTELSHDK